MTSGFEIHTPDLPDTKQVSNYSTTAFSQENMYSIVIGQTIQTEMSVDDNNLAFT
jgi:hypothetical protein